MPVISLLTFGSFAIRAISAELTKAALGRIEQATRSSAKEFRDYFEPARTDILILSLVAAMQELAKRTGAKFFGPAGLIATMIDLGWVTPEQGVRFGKGGTVTQAGPQIKVTQVRAEHSSEVTATDPGTEKSTTYPGGEPAGFIIEFETGFKLYHMGDTGLFGDMRLISEYYKPDLVMIPIGGHFVMDPRDAAYATREMLRPRAAIPFHYGTFPVLRGTPEEYIKALGRTPAQVFPINPGDSLKF